MIHEELLALEGRLDRAIDEAAALLHRLGRRAPRAEESEAPVFYWGDLVVRAGTGPWPGPPGTEPAGWYP